MPDELALRFQQCLMHARGYFILAYPAGTREMVYRYIRSKMGEVEPMLVSAALKILKADSAIIYEKKVWWFLADK